MSLESTTSEICNRLMRAVVASGAIRRNVDSDCTIAQTIMREELKAFLIDGPAYADERELIKTGQAGLAFASLTATCVTRILKERAPAIAASADRPGRHLINEAGAP